MRVMITGGAGFIGSNLARHALRAGLHVTVLDDLSTGYAVNLAGLDLRFVRGTVTSQADVDRALDGVSVVVHLAALGSVPRSLADPVATHEANATGTLMLLEGCRRAGVEQVVYSSSSSVYGSNPALPKSERAWVRPMSPYAVSKLAAEQYVLAYQESFGLRTLAFRFFNVYGPGQRPGHIYAAVIPVFLDALLRGEPLPVNGDGTNSRDFTFVGTVCDVLVAAISKGIAHPEPVNLAFGTNTTLTELIKLIGEVSGLAPDVDYRGPRPGDVPHSQADNGVLRTLFPEVAPTQLPEGLTQTFTWMREQP
jgi:UDP-glucose 4-epimerase